jgi:hypothetical protein
MSETDNGNIHPNPTVEIAWDSSDVLTSLRDVRKNAEVEAKKAIDWYWAKKRTKSGTAQFIQFASLFLAAAAGILPVVGQILKGFLPPAFGKLDSGLVATFCVASAAGLIGLDRAFGWSTGWARYVLTATNITKLLHEFRLDWVAMIAASASPPKPEEQSRLIQRARDFVSTVQGMVLQETQEWATEFRGNLAQLEKDIKVQLETLKARAETTLKDKDDASAAGSIELTVTNADKTDGFQFNITLDGEPGKITDTMANARVWTHINTAPGHYKLGVDGKANGVAVATSMVLDVKPRDIARPSLTLPIP